MIITFIWKDAFWFNASKLAYQISARKRAPNWLRSLSGRKALHELTSKKIDNHQCVGLDDEQLFKKDDNRGLWFHETLMPHFCRWLGERVTEAFYRAMILKSKESCGTVEINVKGMEREVKVTEEESIKIPKEDSLVNERKGDSHLATNNTGNLLKRRNEKDLIPDPEDKVKRLTMNVNGPNLLSNQRFNPTPPEEVSKNGWPVLIQTSLYFCRFEENGGILSSTNANQSPLPFPKIQYVHPSNCKPPVVTVIPYQPEDVVLQQPSHPTMNTLMYSKEFLNAKQQELDGAKEMLELEQKKLETMHKHRFFQLWISTKINKASK